MTPEQQAEFEALTRPVIKFLNDNFHPHAVVVIETDRAELMEGLYVFPCKEFIPD